MEPTSDALLERIKQLENLVHRLSSLPEPVPAIPARSSSADSSLRQPNQFDGTRSKFRTFMYQLELFFNSRPEEFDFLQNRISTFGSLLTDSALHWYLPHAERLASLPSWPAFKEQVQFIFDEPNRAKNAEAKLTRLTQTGSVTAYVGEFSALAIESKWSDNALCYHFQQGLNPEVLDRLLYYEIPSTLAGLYTAAINCEAQLNQIQAVRRRRASKPPKTLPPRFTETTNRPQLSQPRFAVNPVSGDDAMQVDSIRRGPLQPQERERRRQLNLCLYCGGPDHMIRNCPSRTKSLSLMEAPELSGKDQGQ